MYIYVHIYIYIYIHIYVICIYIYIYVYIYMYVYETRKEKAKLAEKWGTNFVVQKVLFLLYFGSCQNCMSSANLVAEIH